MSLLEELNTLLSPLVPVETGVFSKSAPDRYVVITPLADTFELYSDDSPRNESQEARLSLFDKGSYISVKNQIVRALLNAEFTITDRRYVGHEDDTGYHHYAIDVAKIYELEE
ncbi:hypothetical protein B1778_01325 [Dehalococcoides mccartyi]|uniref:hypothetical protein n=1 Tax=Dehalococcoides mccartyi TaxID=61435 RepID=UPI00098EE91D|nr:hypothetical protein [Dehalococcoides mccartyi]AQU05405.1 hypothetical protein B1777_01470 [Dehalococcoides mccartyi]AQU06857.1 hypothetical protein B1778_01325 [Dehalococcoides mccartyi]AQW61951.1 hypothetical protein B1779_01300 [Dehalococcoides mccartyi]